MQSTGLGLASVTNTKLPLPAALAATSVLATWRESTSRSSRSCRKPFSTRIVPSGLGLCSCSSRASASCASFTSERLRSWLPSTVSVKTRVESRASAMRPCTKWMSTRRSGHSMCSVPERRALLSICKTSTTLKVSSVPCTRASAPLSALLPRCLKATRHGPMRAPVAGDARERRRHVYTRGREDRPAHAHLPRLELLRHHLPGLHRALPRAGPRGDRPDEPRRHRRQPQARGSRSPTWAWCSCTASRSRRCSATT